MHLLFQQLKTEVDESRRKYDNLVEFGEDLKAQVDRKIQVAILNVFFTLQSAVVIFMRFKPMDCLYIGQKLQKELSNTKRDYKKVDDEYKKLKEEYDERNNNLSSKDSVS